MLSRNQYFIREHVGILKLTDVYDILDPHTEEKIGEAREEIGAFAKILRLLINKGMLPTTVAVYQCAGETSRTHLFSLRRGFTFLRSKIHIEDATGTKLGYLQSKLISFGGAFRVFTADDSEIALVKGDWKGWNFRFLSGETELGVITKKWSGFGKELFTSADNYLISINGTPEPTIDALLLAAGLAVDTVLKEKK